MSSTAAHEQYFYAPGCVVISVSQAGWLNPEGTGVSIKGATAPAVCALPHLGPINWSDDIFYNRYHIIILFYCFDYTQEQAKTKSPANAEAFTLHALSRRKCAF